MGAVRGVFAGVLALTFLESVVSTKGAAGRVGTAGRDAGSLARHLLSADVPLIPDRRVRASTESSTASKRQTGGSGFASLPGSQFSTRAVAPTVTGT